MVLSLISTMPLVVIPHDLLECRGPGKTAIFRFSGTARMTSPTADRTHLGRRKALPFWRGTGSSNPAPSSGESANLRSLSAPVSGILKAATESEIDAAFATLIQLHAGALLVDADWLFTYRRDQLVALASRHAVPAIYAWREGVVLRPAVIIPPRAQASRRCENTSDAKRRAAKLR
jgi:hypothetical protein